MHELSIAQALAQMVRAHIPAGATLRSLRVRAGAMQAIEAEALMLAWRAATDAGDLAGSQVEVETIPWALVCRACGRSWKTDDPNEPCTCGTAMIDLTGDAQLTLLSIEVNDEN